MVYFAQLESGAIKIGTTEDLEQRLDTLASLYSHRLALLATMPGSFQEEAEIHRRFDHLRFPGTEQFRPGPDLMEFIGKPLLIAANPEMVEATSAMVSVRPVHMTEAYAEWIDQFASAERMGVATLIDRAVAAYAKQVGFKTPPERVP
jgi:hypothetical protein